MGQAEPITLMQPLKIKDRQGLARGEFIVPSAGLLHVKFDNSYSVFRSKTFEYKLTIREEEEPPPKEVIVAARGGGGGKSGGGECRGVT